MDAKVTLPFTFKSRSVYLSQTRISTLIGNLQNQVSSDPKTRQHQLRIVREALTALDFSQTEIDLLFVQLPPVDIKAKDTDPSIFKASSSRTKYATPEAKLEAKRARRKARREKAKAQSKEGA
jgi:hypothetical protein